MVIMRMVKLIILLLSLFTSLPAYAQQSYTISDFGTYIIEFDAGTIKRVPTGQDLALWKNWDWKKYILFNCMGRMGYVLYNVDSGAASDIIYEHGADDGAKILEDGDNLVLFLYAHTFTFDPVSLKLIEKKNVGRLYKEPDSGAEAERVMSEELGYLNERYRNKNNTNYIDITYTIPFFSSLRHLSRYMDIVDYFSAWNRYVLCIHTEDYH
jgi:hypothetical protein